MSEPNTPVGPSQFLQWAVASQAADRGAESGDQYLLRYYPGGALVSVIDGLGHGEKAAAVSLAALAAMEGHEQEPVSALLRRCHQSLSVLDTNIGMVNSATTAALIRRVGSQFLMRR